MGEIRLLVNSLFNWFVYLDKQLLFSLLLTRKTRNGSSVRCISYKQWNNMSLPRRREEVRSSRKRKYSGTSELFLRFSPSLVPPMYLFIYFTANEYWLQISVISPIGRPTVCVVTDLLFQQDCLTCLKKKSADLKLQTMPRPQQRKHCD